MFPICTQEKHHLFLAGTSMSARKNKGKAEIQQARGDDNRRKMDSRKPIFRTTPTREKHIPQQLQRGCLPEGKGGSMRRKRVRREQEEQGEYKICQVTKIRSKENLGEKKSQISGMKFCLITLSTLCISNTKGAAQGPWFGFGSHNFKLSLTTVFPTSLLPRTSGKVAFQWTKIITVTAPDVALASLPFTFLTRHLSPDLSLLFGWTCVNQYGFSHVRSYLLQVHCKIKISTLCSYCSLELSVLQTSVKNPFPFL